MCSPKAYYRWPILFGWAIFLSISMCSTVHSATYFVDYQNGNDSNAGLSQGSPFKHCPGDPRASGNANITLAPGDVIVFKGGVIYSFSSGDSDSHIEANHSGSSGNSIVYISGHLVSPAWGSGRAKIDGANSNIDAATIYGVLDLKNYSYLKVEGLEIYNMDPNLSATTQVGLIRYQGKGSDIVIDNCYLYHTDGTAMFIRASRGPISNVTITNNTMDNSRANLLGFRGQFYDLLIEGNTFDLAGNDPYGTGGANGDNIAFAPYLGTNASNNVVIRGNVFHNSGAIPVKGDMIVQNAFHGLMIEDNYFDGTPNYGSIGVSGNLTNVTIRNNVWHEYPSSFEGILRFRPSSDGFGYVDTLKIYNNTFVCDPAAGSGIVHFHNLGNGDNGPIFTKVDIRNNIFDTIDSTNDYIIEIGNAADGSPLVERSSFTCDNNVYQNVRGGSGPDDGPKFKAAGAEKTFSEWKTWLSNGGASGADAHSNFGQVSFADEAGDNFELTSHDLVAKDRGLDLSSTGFSDDKNGVLRPRGSVWDIGAYESQALPGPSISPPDSLRIVSP